MINQVKLENFGPISGVDWSGLGKINLIIGGNGKGKTFLLKAIYCTLKTLEVYKRGHEQRTASEILANKLYWTFQTEKIGDLVQKGADKLFCKIEFDGREFAYSFGKDTSKQILTLENHVDPRTSNSVFLPAKEVLSLHQIILKTRQQDQVFGFDDTYYDLSQALSTSFTRGRIIEEFAASRKKLKEFLGGTIEYEENAGRWLFVNASRQKFQIGVTAEGIKKIGILDTLLGNRYLDTSSVVIIDEPESALHPMAISQLMDIIGILSERGLQFILASHSYFVVKKLHLLAQEKGWSIPVLSAVKDGWRCDDLSQGMPENPIIQESVNLYEKEVELAFK